MGDVYEYEMGDDVSFEWNGKKLKGTVAGTTGSTAWIYVGTQLYTLPYNRLTLIPKRQRLRLIDHGDYYYTEKV
jgi:hypothetical protein